MPEVAYWGIRLARPSSIHEVRDILVELEVRDAWEDVNIVVGGVVCDVVGGVVGFSDAWDRDRATVR